MHGGDESGDCLLRPRSVGGRRWAMVLYGAAKNGAGTVSIWAGEREEEGKWLLGRTTEEGEGGES